MVGTGCVICICLAHSVALSCPVLLRQGLGTVLSYITA